MFGENHARAETQVSDFQSVYFDPGLAVPSLKLSNNNRTVESNDAFVSTVILNHWFFLSDYLAKKAKLEEEEAKKQKKKKKKKKRKSSTKTSNKKKGRGKGNKHSYDSSEEAEESEESCDLDGYSEDDGKYDDDDGHDDSSTYEADDSEEDYDSDGECIGDEHRVNKERMDNERLLVQSQMEGIPSVAIPGRAEQVDDTPVMVLPSSGRVDVPRAFSAPPGTLSAVATDSVDADADADADGGSGGEEKEEIMEQMAAEEMAQEEELKHKAERRKGQHSHELSLGASAMSPELMLRNLSSESRQYALGTLTPTFKAEAKKKRLRHAQHSGTGSAIGLVGGEGITWDGKSLTPSSKSMRSPSGGRKFFNWGSGTKLGQEKVAQSTRASSGSFWRKNMNSKVSGKQYSSTPSGATTNEMWKSSGSVSPLAGYCGHGVNAHGNMLSVDQLPLGLDVLPEQQQSALEELTMSKSFEKERAKVRKRAQREAVLAQAAHEEMHVEVRVDSTSKGYVFVGVMQSDSQRVDITRPGFMVGFTESSWSLFGYSGRKYHDCSFESYVSDRKGKKQKRRDKADHERRRRKKEAESESDVDGMESDSDERTQNERQIDQILGKKRRSVPILREGDVLRICMKMNRQNEKIDVSYKLNGGDCGVAWKGLEPPLNVGVTLVGKGERLTITSCNYRPIAKEQTCLIL